MPFHYDQDYHHAIAVGGEGSAAERWQCERETVLKYKQRGAILDIGCSSGGFLSTMMSASWKLYGIEMEPSTADRARQTTDAEVFTGDVIEAPFAAESFDVVTSFDVLEHMYDPSTFLAKVLQWLTTRRYLLHQGSKHRLLGGTHAWNLLVWAGIASTSIPFLAALFEVRHGGAWF